MTEVAVAQGSQRAAVDRPSPEMISFMRDNRPRIEKATGLTITQADEKPYGCGGYGCAYATDADKWVIKISSDATEAAMVKTVMDLRQNKSGRGAGPSTVLPGIVFFDGIWMRPDAKGEAMFIIVRENVKPFTEQDIVALDWFHGHRWAKTKHGQSAVNIAQAYAHDFYEAKDSEPKALAAINEYIRWLGVIERQMPLVGDAMKHFLLEEEIVLQDIHEYNVGHTLVDWGKKYRPAGSVIIFDLGDVPTVDIRGRYERLNPTAGGKKLSAKKPRPRRRASIDLRRSPVAPTIRTDWLPDVKVPRLP